MGNCTFLRVGDERLIVGDVVGDDRAPVLLGALEHGLARDAAEASVVLTLLGGDDVVAALAQLERDRRRPYLVEQEPQPEASLASVCSAARWSSSFRSMRASTSSGKRA